MWKPPGTSHWTHVRILSSTSHGRYLYIVRNAYSGLLRSLNQDVHSTKDDVKRMVDHVMTYVQPGGPGNTTSLPDPDVPLNPKEEDFLHITFWRQGPWNTYKKESHERDPEDPIITHYFKDALGN